MVKRLIAFLLFLLWFGFVSNATATIIDIDLNEFYFDSSVTVSADGSSATLAEDPNYFSVVLSSDPIWGASGTLVPDNLESIQFYYNFIEPVSNDDEFYAGIFDGGSGTLMDEFYTSDPGSRQVGFDLSGIDPSIDLLGIEFQLNAWSGDMALTSTLEISDVVMETSSNPIPEPGTMVLFATC